MGTVRSADGTTIAFDRLGSGPAIVLVGGAFSYRAFPKMVELAELLATRFTVINYDRRGRGDSDDTAPYAVAREIEDLEALIEFFADVTFAQPLDRYRLDSAAGPSGTADTEEVFPSAKSSR
jgi:pimeloyl-ACP methyl ester carboxylesterase